MYILSIDPGNELSAYCLIDKNLKPIKFGKVDNEDLLTTIELLIRNYNIDYFAIEMVASYGMAVGRTVFETCVWIGRFAQKVYECSHKTPYFVYRKDEKLCLCGSMKTKDSNIRKALIDRFAKHDFVYGKGSKKEPDWFYGFRADIWQAYAVAITFRDMELKE